MSIATEPRVVYSLKESPYSSHSLLLKRFPAPGRNARVLDLGCGNGYLAALIADRNYTVTGVERPEGVGPDFPSTVRLVTADLEKGLPPLNGQFDLVVCADILEHLRDPLKLLNEASTVLAPGGRVIASLPNSGNLYFRLNVLFGRFPQHDKGLFDRTHVRFFMWDGWTELFKQGGFQVLDVESSGVPVSLAFPKWKNSAPMRAAEAVSYLLARIWKRLFSYQFVIIAVPHSQGS